MVKVKLSNGFEAEIKDNIRKDYRYIQLVTKYQKDPDNWDYFDQLLGMILGDQKESFIESFTDTEGCVPIEAIVTGFKELLDDAQEQDEELKN